MSSQRLHPEQMNLWSHFRRIFLRHAAPVVVALAILLLGNAYAFAQFDSASVLGTISDPSGAAVGSATVQLLDLAKGISVTRPTDANGNYEFTNVAPGDYSVTVSANGFETALTDRFTVTVGARQRVSLALKLGGNTQTVTVSGAASQLETDTSDRGETVQSRETVNLPLNGRSYADLSTLVPGVRKSLLEVLSSPSRDASYNVNGLNSMVNNFQLDGIDNNAYQTANQGYSNEAIIPSPDSVQEFKVQTDNYSAEFGRAAGAVINATTRSGGNQFHGVAYDYLRNTGLNAYGPFIGTGVKPTLVQNQFGGTFGGPIKHDKIFFFTDYEGLRHVDHSLINAVLPTPAQASGTFTDASGNPIALVNPITGTVYPDGKIPVADQSPFAQKILSLLPKPNTVAAAGGNNFVYAPANTITDDKGDARLDVFLNPRSNGFVRYSQRAVTFYLAPNIPGLAGGNSNGTLYARTRQIASGYNFIPSSRSTLDLRLGLTWTESGKSPVNLGSENLLQEFNIPNAPNDPSINGGLNTQSVTGFSQFGRQSTNPQFTNPYIANPKVNYTFLRGRHSFKTGYEYGYLNIAISDFHPQFGADTYAGQFSRSTAAQATDALHRQAYNLADFLVGARSHYELNNLATINYERRWHMGYFQDDYKVSDKFTANLGVRYELVTPNWEQNNHLANFDPTTNTLLQASGGSLYNRSLIDINKNNLAPRVGFAYQVRPGTVIRSGFGIGYLHYFRFGGESTLGYNGPYIVDATIDQTPPFQLSGATQPLCSSVTDTPRTCFRTTQSGYETNFATALNFSTLAAQTRYIPRDFPTGYVESYHLTVQQQLPDNTTLDVAYVGNHGVHIPVLGDFNQASPEPASCNTGIGCTTIQARRPIATFTNILTAFPSGYLNYNSLQTKLEHRYSQGVFLLNSFTWSKAINNASADLETNGGDSANINVFNPAPDRGVSGYDQTFNNTLSVIGDLPFGHGRRYLSGLNTWQQGVVGGWQLTAINLVSSGLPINLNYAPNAQYLVSSTSAPYAVRPNLVSTASAVYAKRANWVKTASSLNGTLNASQVSVPTPSQYFGNAGRNILRGPAFAQLDLAAHKTFPLWSDRRNLEFRMEAFNVLNSTNFQQPDSTVTDGANFGSYTAANAYPSRQVQAALRLSF
jgi:Carboxypeptidase regulatory-like domain/TonB-dependent Receptor Plug Domain/TonB dependent receptor